MKSSDKRIKKKLKGPPVPAGTKQETGLTFGKTIRRKKMPEKEVLKANKEGFRIPAGTEQETGLTRGKTEKPPQKK